MGKFQWDEKLSVNIKEIDDQHKELILMIHRLEDAVTDGSWSKKIVTLSDVLLELTDYLQYHFSNEEKFMIDYNYPEYPFHSGEHQKFVREVITFTEDFRAGKKGLSNDILNFLKDWFLDHIVTVDVKFGAFLSGKGLT